MFDAISKDTRRALREGFVIQIVALVALVVLSCLLPGIEFELACIPFLAHLVIVPVIIWRRPATPTKSDLTIIRIGPEIFLFAMLMAGMLYGYFHEAWCS